MGFESPDFYVFYFNLKWFEPFHLRFFMVCQSPKTLSCQGFQSIKQPHQILKSHRLVRIGWGHSFWWRLLDSNQWPHACEDSIGTSSEGFQKNKAGLPRDSITRRYFPFRCFRPGFSARGSERGSKPSRCPNTPPSNYFLDKAGSLPVYSVALWETLIRFCQDRGKLGGTHRSEVPPIKV